MGIKPVAVSRLSDVQRCKIVEHVPGPQPIFRDRRNRIGEYRVVEALRKLGLISPIPPRSSIPTHTELTTTGREVAAKILAQCAEMLIEAGALDIFEERPLAVLARLRAEGGLIPPVLAEDAPVEPPKPALRA